MSTEGQPEAAAPPIADETQRRLKLLRWARLGIVALVISVVIALLPGSSLGQYLDYEAFQDLVADAGAWAPVLFVGIFTIGTVFLAPASLMSFAAAAVFGKLWGLLWITLAVNLGANAAFAVGRWAARDLVANMVTRSRRGWVTRIGDMLENSGLMTVLVMRVIFSPYNLMNYVAALTRLRYRDYALGTLFGMFPVTFVWVFLGDVLGEVWRRGDIRPLWSWDSVIAATVFLVCVIVPLVLRKRGRL